MYSGTFAAWLRSIPSANSVSIAHGSLLHSATEVFRDGTWNATERAVSPPNRPTTARYIRTIHDLPLSFFGTDLAFLQEVRSYRWRIHHGTSGR